MDEQIEALIRTLNAEADQLRVEANALVAQGEKPNLAAYGFGKADAFNEASRRLRDILENKPGASIG